MRVLFIEDDIQLGKAVNEGLNQDFATDWFTSAEEGQDAIDSAEYDVIVLDINLPKMSGLEWLKKLRNAKNKTPIILLTARDTISERVTGLDTGADDYLVKPFDFEELVARVRALSRRNVNLNTPVISCKSIELDSNSKTVKNNGTMVKVSPLEFDILYLLMKSPGKVYNKQQIEEKIYSWNDEFESNTVEVHISSIRRKLGKDLIKTIRNVGYYIDEK